jgi:hypothetical protein
LRNRHPLNEAGPLWVAAAAATVKDNILSLLARHLAMLGAADPACSLLRAPASPSSPGDLLRQQHIADGQIALGREAPLGDRFAVAAEFIDVHRRAIPRAGVGADDVDALWNPTASPDQVSHERRRACVCSLACDLANRFEN